MTPEEYETCEHAEPYRPFCNDCIRELRTERDRLLQECAERMPTSFGKMKWACGHEGPAVCQKCATSWRNERDRLRAENSLLASAATRVVETYVTWCEDRGPKRPGDWAEFAGAMFELRKTLKTPSSELPTSSSSAEGPTPSEPEAGTVDSDTERKP